MKYTYSVEVKLKTSDWSAFHELINAYRFYQSREVILFGISIFYQTLFKNTFEFIFWQNDRIKRVKKFSSKKRSHSLPQCHDD